MIIPTCDEILDLSGKYDIIPIYCRICADVVTPITLFRHIAERNGRFYLLESVKGDKKQGRCSFLGYSPVMRIICHCGKVKTESHINRFPSRGIQTAHSMDVLREVLAQYKVSRLRRQLPFTGGFVGYFAYAVIEYAEPALHISRDGTNDFDPMLFGKAIVYDHLKQKIQIAVNMKTGRTGRAGRTERGNRKEQEHYEDCKGGEDRENRNTYSDLEYLMKEYGRACEETWEMVPPINGITPLRRLLSSGKPPFVCSASKEEFCDMVEKTKGYILGGNIFRTAMSRQFTSSCEGSLLNAYRAPRITNPSPCVVYVDIDRNEIVSTSPETLVCLENGHLITFPIVGSWPGGDEDEGGRRLEEELLADEREFLEHNMLVDLGGNDIGRIAGFGSVEVTEYKMIHKYPEIIHICSQVEGNIRPSLDGCSMVKSLLLAGTLSGVPEIRACEIIERLEFAPHRIYGEALGYLDFAGNLDTCIAIRITTKQAGKITAQTGGGVVANSVSKLKYGESASKAKTIIRAILQVGEVDDG